MVRTIAIMQPYLFPYLGYFQLIAAADVFVLGDDLQYIRSGWVNRNRILTHDEATLVTFPLKRDRFDMPINQRQLGDTFDEEAHCLIAVITQSYAKAPYFAQVMPLLERLLKFPVKNLALYIEHSIREICTYLHIGTPILRSSDLQIGTPTDKQDRVLRIVQTFSCDRYLNPIGGIELYDPEYFAQNGIFLQFFKMDSIEYRQFKRPFVGNLSIIDVLMFNCVEHVQELLNCYCVFSGAKQEPVKRMTATG
ncbi:MULTISPECIES: WbqC family protein [unclassified Pseudomonas]|uniref:WbqC family protein n=1 Tax=unclassified Pseudomonas TaxID=196821 RepID=UPI002B2366FA|nr:MULTISPECIES: WbqC family protein [unclassified Pseudomonas]MEA9977522.1 WbqC family protein [Pseudomonas sp. RTS4]MEB0198564.1 WbqC family protein [Pseudomonas sp. 5S4]MEB0247906.1 WbqC family protein [Pseudomonas sp. 10S5]